MANNGGQTTSSGYGRTFQIIWVFYFLSFIASYALLPSVPLHLRELGASVKESGQFAAAYMLGSGAGALFTGPLGDRYGQRAVLKWAAIVTTACFVAYAFLNHVWLFFLIGLPHGVVWSGFRTGTITWVGGILPEGRRADGLAIFGMAAPLGAAIGPIVGIWLMPRIGFSTLMLVLAVLSLSLFAILGAPPKTAHTANKPVESLAYKWPGNWIIAPCVVMLCMAICYGAIPSYGAQEAVDNGFLWPSALVSCYGFGMVLLRMFLGWRGMGENPIRLMPAMLAITTASALGLALLPGGLIRHIVCGTVFGATFGLAHTLAWAYAIDRADANRRGSAVGTLYFSYDVGIGLGSFVLGFPMEHLGYRWGWGVGALFLFAAWMVGRRLVVIRGQVSGVSG
ncbi:MAG: MFS transporter [Holophagales bacterium]|jgi:MFS family permease|nr:MFS transporter [Holophagales bacterium]